MGSLSSLLHKQWWAVYVLVTPAAAIATDTTLASAKDSVARTSKHTTQAVLPNPVFEGQLQVMVSLESQLSCGRV